MIYLDTSAIAPFYWTEALSDAIESFIKTEAEPALSQLVEVEPFTPFSIHPVLAASPKYS